MKWKLCLLNGDPRSFYDGPGPGEDCRPFGGLVAPVVQVSAAVELNVQPKVDCGLFLVDGVVPEQFVGHVESAQGVVVAVVSDLDPA